MEQLDSLTVSSRNFYENAKYKVVASLVFGASCLMLLGFCAQAGGLSQYNNLLSDMDGLDSTSEDSLKAQGAGYGFACFVFLCTFLLLFAVALYISTHITGSVNEKRTLKSPYEPEPVYSDSGASAHGAEAQNAKAEV